MFCFVVSQCGQGWKWAKTELCRYGTLSLSLPTFPSPFPYFLFFLPCPFLSSFCIHYLSRCPLPSPAKKSESAVNLPTGSGRRTVSVAFWVENHAPVIALLQKFLGNHSDMLCDSYWTCNLPLWCVSEKKWRYGSEPAKEVCASTTSLPALGIVHCPALRHDHKHGCIGYFGARLFRELFESPCWLNE